MSRPIVTLLTDFGTADHYVAAMKGVILGIVPEAQLVDISHEIKPFQIFEASYELAQACQCFPAGTVHLVVVDPGVGSARRPILAVAGGQRFVAPDNGVLTMALAAIGEQAEIREITNEQFFRQPASQTFHGRDIFAPVAAHLANGTNPDEFGPAVVDPILLDIPTPLQTGPGEWEGAILRVDRFGNAITNLPWSSFNWIARQPFELMAQGTAVSSFHSNYSNGKREGVFAIAGSAGYIELSAQECAAADLLKIGTGTRIFLRQLD